MSGHSKWSTIKRQKGVADTKRSAVFSKLTRLISVAARQGGVDPETNGRLRLAIDRAKTANMPNHNIERAIQAGLGSTAGNQAKEVVYEGFGPGGVAVLVNAVTDNPNRTNADIRNLFGKYNGTLGSPNSVAWMFSVRGTIRLPLAASPSRQAVELELIDAGAEDVYEAGDQLVIETTSEKLSGLKKWLVDHQLAEFTATIDLVPNTSTKIDAAGQEKLFAFFEALEDHPDVTSIISNDA